MYTLKFKFSPLQSRRTRIELRVLVLMTRKVFIIPSKITRRLIRCVHYIQLGIELIVDR